jgi:hypothetical protein
MWLTRQFSRKTPVIQTTTIDNHAVRRPDNLGENAATLRELTSTSFGHLISTPATPHATSVSARRPRSSTGVRWH